MNQRPLHILLAFLGLGLIAGVLLWKKDSPAPLRTPSSSGSQQGQFAAIGKHDADGRPVMPETSAQTASAARATMEFQAMQMRDGIIKQDNAPVAGVKPEDSSSDFDGIGIELVRTRKLPSLPVTSMEANRGEVERLMAQWLTTQYPPDYGPRFGRALTALGAIPQPVDTVALKAAFLSHQIGAWFEKEKEALHVAAPPDDGTKKENALGLAYGNLLGSFGDILFGDSKKLTTDARLARDSLMAGDAALVRLLHSVANPEKGGGGGVGEDPDDPSRNVPIPYFLRELELLPFSAGLNFVKSLHSLGGFDQLDAAYHRPPLSCIEVWDPQVYLADTPFVPSEVGWKELSIGGKQPIWDDRLGALCVVLYLKQHITDTMAGEAASGWANDRFLAYAADGKERDHAVWQTRWKDKAAADRYFEAMKKHLASRYRDAGTELNAAGVLQMKTTGRHITMKRTHQGTGVLFIDAADAAFTAAAMQKLATANP